MIDASRKTLIFDFGNILINLDHPKCFAEFYEVLGMDFSDNIPEKTETVLHRYEKGELNTESFLWHFQQYQPNADVREIIAAWNSILGDLPQSRFDMLAELRKDYNLAMLSNINEMHEKAIHRRVQKEMGIENFHEEYFDKVFYSHRIGYRKPDQGCYEHVQQQLGIEDGHMILFIDDMEQNIVAAKAAGWNGVVHNPQEDIINNMPVYLEVFEN